MIPTNRAERRAMQQEERRFQRRADRLKQKTPRSNSVPMRPEVYRLLYLETIADGQQPSHRSYTALRAMTYLLENGYIEQTDSGMSITPTGSAVLLLPTKELYQRLMHGAAHDTQP